MGDENNVCDAIFFAYLSMLFTYVFGMPFVVASSADVCTLGDSCGKNESCRPGCELTCNQDYCNSKGNPGDHKCLCNEGYERHNKRCVCREECPPAKRDVMRALTRRKRKERAATAARCTGTGATIKGSNLTYSVIVVNESWEEALRACNENNGTLGSLPNKEMSRAVATQFSLQSCGGGWLAIGLVKLGSDGWMWMNGETVAWTNWIAGASGTDACGLATLKPDGTFMKWLDLPCDGTFGPMWALCEQKK